MEYIQDILHSLTMWWVTLESWWKSLWGWLETAKDIFNSILDAFFSFIDSIGWFLGIDEYIHDFVLSWGDWFVGIQRALIIGVISYFTGTFLWRILTYFLGQAIISQASFVTKTGLASYFMIWFWHALFRFTGVGIVTITALGVNLIPKVEAAIASGVRHIPPVFMPMLNYFSVFDAVHYIFSVFVVIATFKTAMWVVKPPLI